MRIRQFMARPIGWATRARQAVVRTATVTRVWWQGRSRLARGLIFGLVFGLLIEAGLHALHHHPAIQMLEDRAMDWTVGLYRNVPPSSADTLPFTFLDIDDETYRRWGSPLFVPRDKLTQLIGAVVKAGPRLVVVDVDVTRTEHIQRTDGPEPVPDVSPAERLPDGERLAPGDKKLQEWLSEYEVAPQADPEVRRPPLIFPRTFAAPSTTAHAGRADDHAEFRRPQRSFLENAVPPDDLVFWASPLFRRSPDWTIRRWRLWERGPPGDASVVPSIQLLAAALLCAPAGEDPARVWTRLEREIESATARTDAKDGREKIAVGCGHDLDAQFDWLNQRILFRYPAREELREGESYPSHPRTQRQLVSVIPAYPITDDSKISEDVFRDRVVVIGGSFVEGRDIHPTPLGPMPGPMILINAIQSLIEGGQLRPLHPVIRYGVVILLIVVLAILFARLSSLIAALGAAALVIVVMLPVSVALFSQGFWLDFSLPLIGIVVHKLFAEVEERVHNAREGARGKP